jgi:hypothetical protein
MPLYIVEKLVGGIIVLDLRGRITLGCETETFRVRIRQLLGAGYRRRILDLNASASLQPDEDATRYRRFLRFRSKLPLRALEGYDWPELKSFASSRRVNRVRPVNPSCAVEVCA